ncbi:MAG: PilZ domain-containing protein [Candidatus Aureabacteria bacterium]|nr:PilZ domain-containing protein [Candidatus Auribacterota bacterium]
MNPLQEQAFIEKRLNPRFTVHYLTDVYLGEEILFATVVDISESGVGITLPGKFYLDEILNLRINCSLIDHEKGELKKVNIYLRASIIWIEKKEKMYHAGLKIIDIAYEDLIRLRDHIDYLEKSCA